MPSKPYKYFTASNTPGNIVTDAYLPGGEDSPAGLESDGEYELQNVSRSDTVYLEERETDGTAGPGQTLRPGQALFYQVNADSPMFAWTQAAHHVTLAISPAPE